MDADVIFKLAQKKTPPPDTLTLSEMKLFTTARNIYKAYADGVVSLEQAQAEKAQVLRRFDLVRYEELTASERRAQLFRLSDEIVSAMTGGKAVSHTHMGLTCTYKIRGAVMRYDEDKGWTYSLELIDNAGCLVYAAMEDVEVHDG